MIFNRAIIIETCSLYSEFLVKVCHSSQISVAGITSHGHQALAFALAHQPDLAFLDLDYVGGSLALARELKELNVNIILISGRLQAFTSYMAERLSVLGCVHRSDMSQNTLAECLESLSRGQRFFSARWEEIRRRMPKRIQGVMNLLTSADVDCLTLIGRGYSDAEIAETIGVSIRTAEGRRSRIMRKLGIYGTPKLMRFAIEQGFTDFWNGDDTGQETSPASRLIDLPLRTASTVTHLRSTIPASLTVQ